MPYEPDDRLKQNFFVTFTSNRLLLLSFAGAGHDMGSRPCASCESVAICSSEEIARQLKNRRN
jgi:hypothetical protein